MSADPPGLPVGDASDHGPALRPRVAIPLAVALVATLAVCLVVLRGTGGPFGPLRAPPLEEWTPARADEVTLWAHEEGLASYQAGAFDEASVLLARAAGGCSDQPMPLFYAGASHLMVERPELAFDLIQRAVDLRPDDPMYRYYLAWSAYEAGRVDEARAQLRAAADGDGPYARKAATTLGRVGP